MSTIYDLVGTYLSLLPKDLLPLLDDYASSDIEISVLRRRNEKVSDTWSTWVFMHITLTGKITVSLTMSALHADLSAFARKLSFRVGESVVWVEWIGGRIAIHDGAIDITLDKWDSQRFARKMQRIL